MILKDLSKGFDCWPDDLLVAKLGTYDIKKKGEKGETIEIKYCMKINSSLGSY